LSFLRMLRILAPLLLMLFALDACAAEVRAMRIWAPKEYTRAVIDLSQEARYKVFALSAPERLVIDLEQASVREGLAPDPRGLITGVRYGKPTKGVLRIVLDLKEPVRPKSFLLKPDEKSKHRLVLDLYSASSPEAKAPARSAAQLERGRRKVVVAIDAGHGGHDPGAIGPAGTQEKKVTLKVALELAQKINREPGMKAFLVRDDDSFVELRERFQKAREAKADLFISVHADAFVQSNVRGSSVFILGERAASSEAARFLADRENGADLVGGVSLSDKDDLLAAVLLDLSQGATLEASAQAADQVLASLKQMGKTHKRYVERANFFVLRSPDVPSMLVETGFISNPDEERKLNDVKHRQRLTDALLSGVRSYFHAAPPPGTWIAANQRVLRHVVARGETLSEIASRHRVSISSLRTVNALNSDVVPVGLVLKIPSSS
jgi:N-acetylmuramoyl-L-alanine amidase